jgi:hypothetical protein
MIMKQRVSFKGKSLNLSITQAAQRMLEKRSSPLLLEMELYFSCLVRKRVHVHEHAGDHPDATSIHEGLSVRFRPVATKSCAISECENGEPQLTDFPIVKPERYFPHWLTLDYKRGEWLAEFGYAAMPTGA